MSRMWQKYTELYKKGLNDPDNQEGVITHLEPDILECEFKWALGSTALNKASGCDRIPVELLKTLKDDAIKCCIQCVSKPGRPTSGHRTGKSQSTSQFPKRVVPKNVLTIGQLHSSAMPRARHPGM